MLAVRVPPSAWTTSQSSVIVRSPRRGRSMQARRDRPIRRWISCVRPPISPRARLALAAFGPGPRQHRVLGGDPAASLAPHPARDAILDRRGADHPRVADADQDRSLGELQVVVHDLHRAELVGGAAVDAAAGCRRRWGVAVVDIAADSTRRRRAGRRRRSSAEGAVEECGHLLAVHDPVRAESRRGAAAGDARLGKAVDGGLKRCAVVVAEVVPGRRAAGRGRGPGSSPSGRGSPS